MDEGARGSDQKCIHFWSAVKTVCHQSFVIGSQRDSRTKTKAAEQPLCPLLEGEKRFPKLS